MNQMYHSSKNRKLKFSGILREYLSRSQVQGYKFIVQTDRPLYERIVWIMITIFGISLTFWVVINSYLEFLDSPTVTSEDPIRKSVLDLSFPAVAICSSNRISRRALIKYSKFILNATNDHDEHIGRYVHEVFETLVRVGQIYTMDVLNEEKMELIHKVLTNVYGGTYPIYDILTKIAPNCTDILKQCKWQGHLVQCSKIFSTRKSYTGPCCTFNYQRLVNNILKTQQEYNHTIPNLVSPEQVHSHGSDFGLTILFDHQLNDYAFTMNSYTGMNVYIYDSYDYPHEETGAIKRRIILPEEEMFLTLHPTVIAGSKSMRSFTVSSRNCVFDDEINLVFANFYSLSECLLTCRISSIIKFCNCLPPQYTNLFNTTLCLFDDVACLSRWRISWYNFEPLLDENFVGDLEINDFHCPECVPKCNRVKYLVHVSESNFDSQEMKKSLYNSDFTNLTDVSNHSIIYINFGSNKVTSYDQTASYVWYELLANLGSVACLSLGATMVSIIEIIYFFSGKLGALCIRKQFRNMHRIRTKFDYIN